MQTIFRAAKRLAVTAVLVTLQLMALPAATADTNSTAFSFGNNSNGQTGLGTASGTTLVATPIDTSNLAGKSITQVATGRSHSLVLADDGSVFSFGSNINGRTGLGTASDDTWAATPIDTTNLAGKSIIQVAAGSSHSLVLADDGNVFSFGANTVGLTGLGTDSGLTLVATPIDTSNLAGKFITQVAAGGGHGLLLADDGSVFSFGDNSNGQTGLGTTSGSTLVATPIDTSNLAGKSITQVAAGERHSLLLADDGSVFSFGANGNGQTGLGTASGNTLVATPIDTSNLASKSITQVAAGTAHSLLLADDGSVFSFGSNGFGRAGLGTISGLALVATPIDPSNLAGKSITQVAAGNIHSLLLADDGSVFSFGSNINGRTGLGTDSGNTLVATPIDATNLVEPHSRVTGISAGGFHSLLTAVAAGLDGDYNDDGVVNAADYTVWRDHLEQQIALVGENSEAVTPGQVDQEDYEFWKSRFGDMLNGDGSSSVAAVPEPTSLLIATASVPWLLLGRNGKRVRTNC